MIISKYLSGSDIGSTNTHQSGIYIPKNVLDFFPKLNKNSKNPRKAISFRDVYGEKWNFNYIYYNNKLFGGTRNEYRLTGIHRFIVSRNLKEQDLIKLVNENGHYFIHYKKTKLKMNIYTGLYDWKVYNKFNDDINHDDIR